MTFSVTYQGPRAFSKHSTNRHCPRNERYAGVSNRVGTGPAQLRRTDPQASTVRYARDRKSKKRVRSSARGFDATITANRRVAQSISRGNARARPACAQRRCTLKYVAAWVDDMVRGEAAAAAGTKLTSKRSGRWKKLSPEYWTRRTSAPRAEEPGPGPNTLQISARDRPFARMIGRTIASRYARQRSTAVSSPV